MTPGSRKVGFSFIIIAVYNILPNGGKMHIKYAFLSFLNKKVTLMYNYKFSLLIISPLISVINYCAILHFISENIQKQK